MARKQKSLEGTAEDQANRAKRIRYLREALRFSIAKFGKKTWHSTLQYKGLGEHTKCWVNSGWGT